MTAVYIIQTAHQISVTGFAGIIDHKYDPDFKKYHQMSLKILKEFGFGQNRVTENRIRLEVEDLISFVESVDGKAFSPDVELTSSVLNVIASIIFGA